MNPTETFLDIIQLTRQFNQIQRVVNVGKAERENDSEHSYQVSLGSWFIAEQLGLQDLNMERVIMFALVHDLPEVYAKDMSSIVATSEQTASHKSDEATALQRLEREFAGFPSLTAAVRSYEAMDTVEAELVFFVDKILPVINVWMSRDSYYIDNGITFSAWRAKQYGRIERLREFDRFHQLIGSSVLSLIEAHAAELFAPETH
jgi:5'-deoxynucleotidase YfbR-like HD superfamily hydrolase